MSLRISSISMLASLIGLVCVGYGTLSAQDYSAFSFSAGPSVQVGGGSGQAETPLPVYSLSSGCGTFASSGSTSLFRVGAEGMLRLHHNDPLGLRWSLTAGKLSGEFLGEPLDEQKTTDDRTGEILIIDRQFRLDYTIHSIQLDLMADFALWQRLHALIGPRLSYRWNTEFEQTDNVTGPGDQSFADGQRTHVVETGFPYEPQSFSYGVVGGVALAIPLRKNLFLEPRVLVETDLLSPAANYPWQTFGVLAGLSVQYDLSPEHIPPAPPPSDPQVPPPPPIPLPVATIHISGVNENGVESEITKIKARETLYERRLPILPFMFFSAGSATLPERYEPETETETGSTISLVDVNHDLLSIIARRLQENPGATLDIAGVASGDEDKGVEEQRAGKMRAQLAELGIAPGRIRIGSATSRRSDERTPEGREENRRVEIRSENPDLTEPYVVREVVRDFSPPVLRISPDYETPAGLLSWELSVLYHDKVMTSYTNADRAAGRSPNFDWRISQSQSDTTLAPIIARFTVVDSLGRSTTVYDTMRVEMDSEHTFVDQDIEHHIDGERSQTWIIGFEYDSERLTARQETGLGKIASRIRSGATVHVVGYTDRIGTDEYNLALSQRRAESIAERLRELLRAGNIQDVVIESEGAGVDRTLFNNDLPEGRALSRSVMITVDQDRID